MALRESRWIWSASGAVAVTVNTSMPCNYVRSLPNAVAIRSRNVQFFLRCPFTSLCNCWWFRI